MQPTPKDAHKDSALSNIAIGYRNAMYVADRVFPNVPVVKQSDYFFTFRKGAWFRNEAKPRGPGAVAAGGGYPLTSTTYTAIEYAYRHPVPIQLINNADKVLRPFETGVKFCMDKLLGEKDVNASSVIMNTSNWTTTNDADAKWAATAGTDSTFIEDINAGKETIRRLIGRYPNRMLLDAKTFVAQKECVDVLDRIKYTGTQGRPADVTAQTLAQLFELDEVIIGTALYSSAEEVVAGTDFTAVDLWEVTATKGSCLLYYAPEAPAIDVPAAGYTFVWKGDEGQQDEVVESDVYRQVRRWWDSERKSWMIEAAESFDCKITSADAGMLFYDTIVT
jgi:hypothetical protein